MNKVKFILLVCTAVLIGSCQDAFDEQDLSMEIQLKSFVPSVPSAKATTEGYDYDTVFDGDGLGISLLRWDSSGSTDPAVLISNPLTATLGNPDPSDSWKRTITITPPEYFKDAVSEVGFAGCYPPIDGWAATADRKMTYNIDGATDVLVSDFKKGSLATGIEPLTFRHALCMYKVYTYAVDDQAQAQWGDLSKITFLNLPDQLFVNLPADITTGKATFTFTPKPESNKDYTPSSINIPEGSRALQIGMDNKTYVGTYLGGPPAIGVLGVSVEASKQASVSPISIARNFVPGHAYSLILRFSTHGIINAEVIVDDWSSEAITIPPAQASTKFYTDLSRYGTANSYVVTSANMGYSFNVKVKGNGVNTLSGFKKQISLPDTDITLNTASVRLLESDASFKWDAQAEKYVPITNPEERKNAQMIAVEENLSENQARFVVIGSNVTDDYHLIYKGNALIGGFDSMGNLIWSWITDKPLNINYGNGYVVMDRNLGAVSSNPDDYINETYSLSALCYQWGRKDPLSILDLKQYGTEHVIAGPLDIATAHQNPGKFISLTLSQHQGGQYDWTTQTNPHLWGYISDRDDIKKTLYDPCPPGYRVSGNQIWEYGGTDMKEPVYTTKTINGNEEKTGYIFGIENYTDIYYPANTFIEYNGSLVENSGHGSTDNGDPYVYQYSATPYIPTSGETGMEGLSYHFRYNKTSTSYPGYSTLVYAPNLCGGRVHAYPVRCVYENSRKAIKNLSAEQTSNSYLIDEAGFYKFNANIPGNGVGTLAVQHENGSIQQILFDGGVGYNLGNKVQRVDVLWWQGDLQSGSRYSNFCKRDPDQDAIENECPVVILDNGLLDGDYAVFQIPKDKFQNANVILAGYDTNDAIVWTWHLWIIEGGVNVVRVGNFTVMDRNMGATYAPTSLIEVDADNVVATYGFHYQWGRKDPFVPRAAYNSDSGSIWFLKDIDGNWIKKAGVDTYSGYFNDVTSSISNPTMFAVSGSSYHAWQSQYPNASAAGTTDTSPANQLWGYTGVPNAWGDTFAKTMWDPCPPGYKLSTQTTYDSGGLWEGDTSHGNVGNESNYRNLNGKDYKNNFGLYLDSGVQAASNNLNIDGLWIPYNRMLSHVNGKYTYLRNEKEFHLHTACPTGGFGSREMIIHTSMTDYNEIVTTVSQYTAPTARGSAVRCLKE